MIRPDKILCIRQARYLCVFLMVWIAYPPSQGLAFGFHAHRVINRMAVYTLPPMMIGLYKRHIEFLAERSIDPDRRAHVVEEEAPRHYIDIDHFGDLPFQAMPRLWVQAKEKYSQDTLMKYGVLPWHIHEMTQRLTAAFRRGNLDQILLSSAHLGHYIADACTPLHTTLHYNGRTKEERGIHALWESRLPELYAHNYDYLTGRAEYISNPLDKAWELVEQSHKHVENLYQVYDSLQHIIPSDQMYVYEMRGQTTGQTFSHTFSSAYHQRLNHMVEQQMQQAVKSTGDFWFTAWVDAGQPDLDVFTSQSISQRLLRLINYQNSQWPEIKDTTVRSHR